MKKLVAAVLTGVLVAGTLSTGVYAKDDDKTITVAASATPHAEILEEAKPLLEKEGYDLEVTVFDDYVRPNEVVESGEFDANYFQHIPYLDQFNEEKGTHLVNAGGIHYEPFGIYPGTKDSLDDLEDGDSIAVPNDTTNEARALLLLQDNGIITLKDGAGHLKNYSSSPAPSFRVITPLSWRRRSALASFVVSFGTAMESPSSRSSRLSFVPG